jgi:broad specificity phosphatase PhoE
MRTTRRAALAALLTLLALQPLNAQTPTAGTPSPTTTIVLVRHAEKAAEPAADPPLTAHGAARAQALLDALADARIDAVYSTQFERTRTTAEPLAKAAGVDVTIVPAGRGAPDYIGAVAERARTEHPGGVVVIVGHSNTLGRTIAALGGPDDLGDLADDVYDTFYVLLLTEGETPHLIRARYGAPNGP